ncbi:hypothetical protein Q5752_005322 [Cryptotrichosporon argae]
MSDCVAIAAEFPFRQQIVETLQHGYRSKPTDQQAGGRDYMTSLDAELKPVDGAAEASADAKRAVIKKVVAVYVETKGALEAPKEAEAESAHILLQHLVATNFVTSSAEYAELVTSIIDAVRAGGEAAVSASRLSKAETASRILSNTYNFLAPTSPLRPTALLALITLLAASGDVSTLPLSPAQLAVSVAQWSVSDSDRVAFLSSAADLYARASDFRAAATIAALALRFSADRAVVDKALAYALATDSLDVDDVLKAQGVREQLTGEMAELVELFSTVDEIEAVGKGQQWVGAHKTFLDSFGLAPLNGEEIVRKLRLVALGALAARAPSKQLSYDEVASALQVDAADVEAWVIDAISANVIQARLSQPLSQVRIVSVSARATRRFGPDEWQLLGRRLGEWKAAVAEARQVVEDAEAVAAQPARERKQRRDDEAAA